MGQQYVGSGYARKTIRGGGKRRGQYASNQL